MTLAPIATAVAGNSLVLSLPMDHTGWRLQAQTNDAGVELGTGRVDAGDSPQTTQVAFPIDASQGAVFFRRVFP